MRLAIVTQFKDRTPNMGPRIVARLNGVRRVWRYVDQLSAARNHRGAAEALIKHLGLQSGDHWIAGVIDQARSVFVDSQGVDDSPPLLASPGRPVLTPFLRPRDEKL